MSALIIVTPIQQISLKMLHPRNLSDQSTQIPRYKFKLDRVFNLNLYREIPSNLSLAIKSCNQVLQGDVGNAAP